jgi:hypothetical protein
MMLLDRDRASFEASLREAPQDEEDFEMRFTAFLILRSAAGASRGTQGRFAAK